MRRLPLSRLIWFGPSAVWIRATEDRGTTTPVEETIGKAARLAVEAPIALEDAARFCAADGRGDCLRDVRGRQAVVGGREAIDADRQRGQPRRQFDPHVGGTRRFLQGAGDLVAHALQGVEVIAIDENRQIGPDAGDQLVEA